jgi:hypothetical protein
MTTPKPAQLAEILLRLGGPPIEGPQELCQLVSKACDVLTDLELVARAIPDPSKTPRPPSYAFGPQSAAKAERAIPYAKELIYALQQGDLTAARVAAQETDNQFAP